MHAIPITQMEITRDANSVFCKDLPLHPYYKALTSDILQAKGSMKYSKIQDIEDFFKQYICEKENAEEKSADSQRDDENYEENQEVYQDSDVFPSSDYSSKYEENYQESQKNYKSATSLQEMLEKRELLGKIQGNPAKKPKNLQENAEKALKPRENQQEYYAFPNKYKNYKYKKLQNFEVFPAVVLKNRHVLRKLREKSFEKPKFSTEISETSTFSRTCAQKLLKTQQKPFLLPEERKSLILKNLATLKTNNLLSLQAFSTGNRWISPFLKQSLPRIPEHFKETPRSPDFMRKTRRNFEENGKNIAICGKTVVLPKNHSKNLQRFAENPEKMAKFARNDFKKLYNELEVLRNLSKKDAKTLKIQRNPSLLLNNSRKDCEILRLSVFLEYFKQEFAGKNWALSKKMLESCGFRIENEFLCVNFAGFVRFHRIFVEKIADFEEKASFFASFLANGRETAPVSLIKSALELIFASKAPQKPEKPEKLRVFKAISLENAENSEQLFEKSALQAKLLRKPEVIKILSHFLC